MPHLSPLYWLYMYMFMIFWMLLILIKINFLIKFYPIKNKINYSNKFMNWKI
uniref:ATP synthase F0 subunit 8 n=2 Tax=Anterhynchium TaxID=329989 RepID=A0A6M9ATJ3_9HYME|nr:ATP synthase F0 subunit 8 [Anterhynchium aff. flavomarginatum HB]QKK69275.1 ATP synthase F0 subunit 8 [Anterhynchium aff. flavomarginatum SC]